MKILIISFFACILSGCDIGGLSIRNIDAYPPDLYTQWNTPGKSNLDTKKSLLECGFKSPYNYELSTPEDWDMNYEISMNICMEHLGYIRSGWSPGFPICSDKTYKIQKNCHQPGADIIKPSAERRLNSRYCKSERAHDRPECQP
jgi:hypothetical protein